MRSVALAVTEGLVYIKMEDYTATNVWRNEHEKTGGENGTAINGDKLWSAVCGKSNMGLHA